MEETADIHGLQIWDHKTEIFPNQKIFRKNCGILPTKLWLKWHRYNTTKTCLGSGNRTSINAHVFVVVSLSFQWFGLLGVSSLKARWNHNSEQLFTEEEINCHVMQVIFFNMQMLLKLQFTVEQLYNVIIHTNKRLKIVPRRLQNQFRTCADLHFYVFTCFCLFAPMAVGRTWILPWWSRSYVVESRKPQTPGRHSKEYGGRGGLGVAKGNLVMQGGPDCREQTLYESRFFWPSAWLCYKTSWGVCNCKVLLLEEMVVILKEPGLFENASIRSGWRSIKQQTGFLISSLLNLIRPSPDPITDPWSLCLLQSPIPAFKLQTTMATWIDGWRIMFVSWGRWAAQIHVGFFSLYWLPRDDAMLSHAS